MRTNLIRKAGAVFLFCAIITLAGCYIQVNGCGMGREKCEKTVKLTEGMGKGGTFAAETHNGSITITGAETNDCNVTAVITARAVSKERAEQIAAETKVKLERSGEKLTVQIEKPVLGANESVDASYSVKLPRNMNLELKTHNGNIAIADIEGNVRGETHNGNIDATHTAGTIDFKTHNGSIACNDVKGNLKLVTHNGNIKTIYAQDAGGICEVSGETHNGSIDVTLPHKFSGKADIATHNGAIRTNLPITVVGEVGKRHIEGTIGSGEGKLYLKTHNGSISIR